MKFFKPKTLIIIFIILGIIFLRLWKIPDLFYFGIDEEYHAHLAASIVKDFHLIWIGANAGNTGFYLGPGFIYLNALLFWISKGDPIILAYFSSLLGLLTILILYLVTKEIFNKKIGLITTILYGYSAFVVFYDRRFWNPTFIPLITILLYYCFIKSLTNQSWLIVSSFLTALSFHFHLSLIIFFPLIFIQLFLLIRSRLIKLKTVIISIFVYLITISPLIVYDFVHNFDNLKTPLRMILSAGNSQSHINLISKIKNIFLSVSQFYLVNNNQLINLIFGLLFLLILIFLIRKRKKQSEIVLGFFMSLYVLFTLLYPGVFNDYYGLSFLPFVAILSGIFLSRIKSNFLVAALFLFILFNVKTFIANSKLSEDKGLRIKKEIVLKTCKLLKNQPYSFLTNGPYINYGGWGYLFKIYCYPPLQNQADDMFAWMHPEEISNQKPEYKVILSDIGSSSKTFDKEKPVKTFILNLYRINIFLN